MVGDIPHAMLLTNGMTKDHRTEIDGATVVGGAHCLVASTEGVEHQCIDWTPTVVFLHPDGSVVKVVTGPEHMRVGVDSVTVSPATRASTSRWCSTTGSPSTSRGSGRCPGRGTCGCMPTARRHPGRVSPGVEQRRPEPGRRRAQDAGLVLDGRREVNEPRESRHLRLDAGQRSRRPLRGRRSRHRPGSRHRIVGASGRHERPEGLRHRRRHGRRRSGVRPVGSALRRVPPSEGRAPQVLGGPPSVTVRADDRGAGPSADGKYVLFGGPHGERIVPT